MSSWVSRTFAALLFLISGKGWAAPFAWPNPGTVAYVEVPGYLRTLGIPMKLQALRMKRKPAEVVDLYLAAFRAAGLYLPPPRLQPAYLQEPMLTALDPERRIAYTVIFQANPDRTTTVVLGEANLALRQSAADDFPPIFPGAEGVLRSDQEGAQVLSYAVAATPDQVRSFYRELLGKRGYAQPDPLHAPEVFSKDGAQIRLLVALRRGGSAVAVVQQPAASP